MRGFSLICAERTNAGIAAKRLISATMAASHPGSVRARHKFAVTTLVLGASALLAMTAAYLATHPRDRAAVSSSSQVGHAPPTMIESACESLMPAVRCFARS